MGIREGDIESDAATPEVDMTGLTMQQQDVIQKVLKEEVASFAKNDDGIGCIEDLQIDIYLSDSTPVKRNYVSIPRPLYQEVKHYTEYMLNRQFITKSRSSYSSPVVCVRKKDGTLRLCMDYRELKHTYIHILFYLVSYTSYIDIVPLLTDTRSQGSKKLWMA